MKDSDHINNELFHSLKYRIRCSVWKLTQRKLIIFVVHSFRFCKLIFISENIEDLKSSLYTFFKLKSSNCLVFVMLRSSANKLTLSLIIYSSTNSCYRQFTLSSNNFSRAQRSEVLWVSRLVLLTDVEINKASWRVSSSSFWVLSKKSWASEKLLSFCMI